MNIIDPARIAILDYLSDTPDELIEEFSLTPQYIEITEYPQNDEPLYVVVFVDASGTLIHASEVLLTLN